MQQRVAVPGQGWKMADLEPYEQFYYGGQVEGRGPQTPAELVAEFTARVEGYDEIFGDGLAGLRDAPAIDLACGYGNFLFYLRSRAWTDMRGVDLDSEQVGLARSLGLPASEGNALSALTDGAGYGLVSAFDLIEHLDKNDAVSLLLQARRALRPGGALILQCPCADGFRGANDLCNDLTHRWSPTSIVLRQMLRTAGFSRVDIIDMSLPPHPRSIRRKIKYAVRRLARRTVSPVMSVLGIVPPPVWSNSQIAVAWK